MTADQTGPQTKAPGRLARWRARRAERTTTAAVEPAPAPLVHPLAQASATVAEWSANVDQRAVDQAAQAIADRVDLDQVTGRAGRLVRRRAASVPAADRAARGRLALAVPLVGVNASALGGQIGWAMDHLGRAEWLDAIPHGVELRAVAFAATLESIGVYLSYEAHQALLARVAALKLRLGAYAVGAIAAAMNYSHYAGADWHPTAAAVGYGLLSLASPMLWTVWSMARSRRKLVADGAVDGRSARFSAAKKVFFPLRTLRAMRYAVDHGITDERPAWDAYREHREQRRADRALRQADADHATACRPAGPRGLRAWLVRRLGGAVVLDLPAAELDQPAPDQDTPDQTEDRPRAPRRTTTRRRTTADRAGSLDHAGRVAALLDRYPDTIPARRAVQADMRPTGRGWSNSQQVQDAINEARRRRATNKKG